MIWRHRKSSQKPSETNKISFTSWYPSPPPPPVKRTKVRTPGFNSQTNVCTTHHSKPEVRFFRKPPPKRILFVSLGFSELLRWSLRCPVVFADTRLGLGFDKVWIRFSPTENDENREGKHFNQSSNLAGQDLMLSVVTRFEHRRRVPSIAQLVERRTVGACALHGSNP